jgi:plastocyanin
VVYLRRDDWQQKRIEWALCLQGGTKMKGSFSETVQPESISYGLGLSKYGSRHEIPDWRKGEIVMRRAATFIFLTGCLIAAGGAPAGAQSQPSFAQVVALDECDPATFNTSTGAGPDFCKNVALGASTTLADLFAKAAAGTPDANWDFEPDNLTIKQGQVISVVDQGGEPHTFTEVKQFGGGFIPGLNGPGETVVPECAGGFSTLAVAKTRVLQGSHLDVIGLSKGKHLFQCCIHPWMRVEVDVK